MPQRARVTIDIGANAPIETVASVIEDLNVLAQFGGALQEVSDRERARYEIARRPGPWISAKDEDEYYGRGVVFFSGLHRRPFTELDFVAVPERAVQAYLQEFSAFEEWTTRIERLEYRNPVDMVCAIGAIAYGVYLAVRDWPERRRLNRARVDDYESEVALKKEIRQYLASQLATGRFQPTAEQIDALLTSDVTNAFKNIGNARPQIELLGRGQDDSEES